MTHGFDIPNYIEILKDDIPDPIESGVWRFSASAIDPLTGMKYNLSYSIIDGSYAVIANAKYGGDFHLSDISKRSSDTTFYMRPFRRKNDSGTTEPIFVR